MRPRYLEIEAIGPFGRTVEVDFDALAVEGLFLIHGPTGAGKTSLLDGVCFALYGRVPGTRAKARSDRSHHAEWGTAPRALLEFDAQGSRYRVERTMAWEAPKARGSGTTPRPATAVLRRLDGGAGSVIAAKPSEVDAEIERLLGLTAAQFQQVILLPQGKFEKVLQANSKEREELFETLFDTVDFKVATEWLEQEARGRRVRVNALRQQLANLGSEAIRRSAEILERPVRVSVETRSVGTPASVALLDPDRELDAIDPSDPDAIAGLVEAVSAVATASGSRAIEADEQVTAMRANLEGATRVAELVARRDRLLTLRSELESRSAQVEANRSRLELAASAESLRPSLDEVDHRTNVVRKTRHAVASDLLAARDAVGRLPVEVPEVQRLDLSCVPNNRDLAEASSALAVWRDRIESLRETERSAKDLRQRLEEVSARIDSGEATAEQARARVEHLTGSLPSLEAAVDAARSAAVKVPELGRSLIAAEEKLAAVSALAEVERRLEVSERTLEEGRSRSNDLRESYLRALERYLEGIAAHLAGRLELDEACLVCGSHEHPHPATPSPDAVSKEEVESLRGDADAAEAKLADLTEVHHRYLNEATALRTAAGDVADDADRARRLVLDAKVAHAEAVEQADRLEDSQSRLAEARAAIRADEEKAGTVEAQVAGDRALREALSEQLRLAVEELARSIPGDFGLEALVAAVEDAVAMLDRVGDHAADGLEAASKLEAAIERADAELARSIFRDAASARSAMLDPDEYATLREFVEEHDRRLLEVASRLAEGDLDGLPDEGPDLPSLREELTAASRRRDAAVESRTLAVTARDAVERLLVDHRRTDEEVRRAEADAVLHERVANRCSGRTAPRVPLQRWVLGAYLEEVCAHANRRLAAMTAGRYRLLVTRTPAKANQPAGLDLRIHDANTNTEREVSTLSGGETFQASLALALGVADSVESHSGGVRLEALFIDEGFGSLDADALELAMDELDGLRSGGRMVGVISHVPRLRERIRVGAEVHKGVDGSTVTVGEVSPP